jgi:hypothetical protein
MVPKLPDRVSQAGRRLGVKRLTGDKFVLYRPSAAPVQSPNHRIRFGQSRSCAGPRDERRGRDDRTIIAKAGVHPVQGIPKRLKRVSDNPPAWANLVVVRCRVIVPDHYVMTSAGVMPHSFRQYEAEGVIEADEDATAEAATVAGAAEASQADLRKELAAVDEMLDIAENAARRPDARAHWLMGWIKANLMKCASWNDRRLIIFTEWEDFAHM